MDPSSPAPKRYVLRRAAPSKSYRVDYQRELNPEQREVVFSPDGPALVVAGAGSGETRAIVYRVSRPLEDGVDAPSPPPLTFPNPPPPQLTPRPGGLLGAAPQRAQARSF